MKLSQIYSNRDDIFPPIRFKPGKNVILAKVRHPKDPTRDSHCLGKTILISLIDFLLLKQLRQEHFLKIHSSRFAGIDFYLEIELNSGKYVTIKRSVDNTALVSIQQHDDKYISLVNWPSNHWTLEDIGQGKAEKFLNDILNLSIVHPEQYRRAAGYFLRTQKDYLDVFQLSKFLGKHGYWKPLMGKLLGFNWSLLKEKYDVDNLIDKVNNEKKALSSNSSIGTNEYDKVKATLAIKKAEADDLKADIDRFNFYRYENGINTKLIEKVEYEIADLNEAVYTFGCELQRIQESLEAKVVFDVNRVNALFEEMQIHFTESLRKSYSQLLDFNRKIYEERNDRLKQRMQTLLVEIENANTQLSKLNDEREQILSVMQDKDSFRKFKTYSIALGEREGEVARLEAHLEHLDVVAGKEREKKRLDAQRNEIIDSIEDDVNNGNPEYDSIRKHFDTILHRILNQHALIFTTVNSDGNLSFSANILDGDIMSTATSEGEGTSYKKLMCAAFDLSLLLTYSQRGFYRFVYHDGLLEGLDDRKKNEVLNVISDCCEHYGIQHIITVIEHDLPMCVNGERMTLDPKTIVRELHDDGDDGRLFKMPAF